MSAKDAIFIGLGAAMFLCGVVWRGTEPAQRAQQRGAALLGLGIVSMRVDGLGLPAGVSLGVDIVGGAALLLGCFYVARSSYLRNGLGRGTAT